jgi:hypothetical protein
MIAEQLGRINSRIEASRRATEFCQYAATLLRSKGNLRQAVEFADAAQLPPLVRQSLKSAVAGGIIDDMGALAPYRTLAEGFSSTLTAASCFDAILAGGAHVAPLHSQFGVTTIDASPATVSEGAGKKIARGSFVGGTLVERKAAAIVSVSDDLLRFAAAVALIERSLRDGISKAVDSIFLTALIAGTTPIASTGATAAAVLHDVRLLLDGTGVSGDSRFHLVVPPAIAAHLAVMATATATGELAFPQMTPTGGVVGGIQVHNSDALTNTAVLVDAAQIVAGGEPVGISTSQNASLQMDSVPTQATAAGSPPTPAASVVVSMFQANASAIRCERRFGWSLLRANAVQSLSGVSWGT